MQRSRLETFIILVVVVIWAAAVTNGLLTDKPVDPYVHWIAGAVVFGVLNIRAWRNGR